MAITALLYGKNKLILTYVLTKRFKISVKYKQILLRIPYSLPFSAQSFQFCGIDAHHSVYVLQVMLYYIFYYKNHIGGVMVSVLASSVVDRGFIGGVMVSMLASIAVDCGFEP